MIRILIFFFTLNALLLPASGYAAMSMSESLMMSAKIDHAVMQNADVGDEILDQANSKCHMPMTKECANCNTMNMDMDCNTGCCNHCTSHTASLPTFFSHKTLQTQYNGVATVFKHFYLHTTSPEQRPPLV